MRQSAAGAWQFRLLMCPDTRGEYFSMKRSSRLVRAGKKNAVFPGNSHIRQFAEDLFRRDTLHTGMIMPADMLSFPGSAAVQRAGTARQIRLDDPIMLPGREKAPFAAGGAEKGKHRRLYPVGQVHGTGISGNERTRAGEQADEFAEACFIDEIQRVRIIF